MSLHIKALCLYFFDSDYQEGKAELPAGPVQGETPRCCANPAGRPECYRGETIHSAGYGGFDVFSTVTDPEKVNSEGILVRY